MEKNKNKIALILPYYGTWPSYFNLYLASCKFNSTVDFIFFTDIVAPENHPKNVFFYSSSLDSFNELATSKIGEVVKVTSSYKICDIRPAFGKIYEDYLTEYDYWGFGDIDLFYGDLNKFISPSLGVFDVISFKPWWLSGCFSLYRNIEVVNNLYQESKSWRGVFADPNHLCFDECHKHWERLRKGERIFDIDKNQSFTYLVKKATEEGRLTSVFLNTLKESIPAGDFLKISQSKVCSINTDEEYMLYHMISEKKSFVFETPKWKIEPNIYYINSTGFFTQEEFLSSKKNMKIFLRTLKGGYRWSWFYLKKIVKRILSL